MSWARAKLPLFLLIYCGLCTALRPRILRKRTKFTEFPYEHRQDTTFYLTEQLPHPLDKYDMVLPTQYADTLRTVCENLEADSDHKLLHGIDLAEEQLASTSAALEEARAKGENFDKDELGHRRDGRYWAQRGHLDKEISRWKTIKKQQTEELIAMRKRWDEGQAVSQRQYLAAKVALNKLFEENEKAIKSYLHLQHPQTPEDERLVQRAKDIMKRRGEW